MTTPAIVGFADDALMVPTLLLIRPYLFANRISSRRLSPIRDCPPIRFGCTLNRIIDGGRTAAAERINLPGYIFVAEATSTLIAGGSNIILGESKLPDGVELDASTRRTLDAWVRHEFSPESVAPTFKISNSGWCVVPRLGQQAYGSRLPNGGRLTCAGKSHRGINSQRLQKNVRSQRRCRSLRLPVHQPGAMTAVWSPGTVAARCQFDGGRCASDLYPTVRR
jgi:hypothetical protein